MRKPDHNAIERNIGTGIYKLVATGMKVEDLGTLMAGLIAAAVKAPLAGDQTDAQIEKEQAKALKAVARKLARKVKML